MAVFKHTALVCRSEENADRFYQQLLGLKKAAPKTLPRDLAMDIFNVDSELALINYTGVNMQFEIFIADGHAGEAGKIEHTCIEVGERQLFLDACRELGVSVNLVQKEAKTLIFVQDFDGNLFEIKPNPLS